MMESVEEMVEDALVQIGLLDSTSEYFYSDDDEDTETEEYEKKGKELANSDTEEDVLLHSEDTSSGEDTDFEDNFNKTNSKGETSAEISFSHDYHSDDEDCTSEGLSSDYETSFELSPGDELSSRTNYDDTSYELSPRSHLFSGLSPRTAMPYEFSPRINSFNGLSPRTTTSYEISPRVDFSPRTNSLRGSSPRTETDFDEICDEFSETKIEHDESVKKLSSIQEKLIEHDESVKKLSSIQDNFSTQIGGIEDVMLLKRRSTESTIAAYHSDEGQEVNISRMPQMVQLPFSLSDLSKCVDDLEHSDKVSQHEESQKSWQSTVTIFPESMRDKRESLKKKRSNDKPDSVEVDRASRDDFPVVVDHLLHQLDLSVPSLRVTSPKLKLKASQEFAPMTKLELYDRYVCSSEAEPEATSISSKSCSNDDDAREELVEWVQKLDFMPPLKLPICETKSERKPKEDEEDPDITKNQQEEVVNWALTLWTEMADGGTAKQEDITKKLTEEMRKKSVDNAEIALQIKNAS